MTQWTEGLELSAPPHRAPGARTRALRSALATLALVAGVGVLGFGASRALSTAMTSPSATLAARPHVGTTAPAAASSAVTAAAGTGSGRVVALSSPPAGRGLDDSARRRSGESLGPVSGGADG
ncbi:MAG TPA: hypothetical protein VND23_00940 [Acidimicrobiales bacterium]|nr:hypothetical protein [Acidimicrobiales bacterium]